jgi:hypothetical protein
MFPTNVSVENQKQKKPTVGIIPKSNIKIVEKSKIDTLSHKYLTAHFLGFL